MKKGFLALSFVLALVNITSLSAATAATLVFANKYGDSRYTPGKTEITSVLSYRYEKNGVKMNALSLHNIGGQQCTITQEALPDTDFSSLAMNLLKSSVEVKCKIDSSEILEGNVWAQAKEVSLFDSK